MSKSEQVHKLQNTLAAATSAATMLVTHWQRMNDGQRYEMAEMVARRSSELQEVLAPLLAKMAIHAEG